MPIRPTIAAALAALTLVSVACGGDGADPAPPAAATPPSVTRSPSADDRASAAPSEATEPPVAQVLAFEAPLLGGGTLRGESLAGRDVAFWFWAPW